MTAARLSPAASLLRNSKLFGLPPAIALPSIEPSSEPVPRSDTATKIYPTHAAIETRYDSLYRGDWGLKRPLPLKSTTKTNAPVIRLNNGIDTAEHIADFDSAADHVLTLKKFQELNQSLRVPTGNVATDSTVRRPNVFQAQYDNTTNASLTAPANSKYTGIWPNIKPLNSRDGSSQGPKQSTGDLLAPREAAQRWRYDGPSLVQMSALEFDHYLSSLDASKRLAFRQKVKEHMIQQRREAAPAAARDAGTVGEDDVVNTTVSDEEVESYVRILRQSPRKFGPLLSEFLDLPDGPEARGVYTEISHGGSWEYRGRTIASDYYQQMGPPRTHPSAGLSYIHSKRFVENHASFGPQHERLPSVARMVKIRTGRASKKLIDYGLAGFIVEPPRTRSARHSVDGVAFDPSKQGGQKLAVFPAEAEISEKGSLQMSTKHNDGWKVEDDKAVHYGVSKQAIERQAENASVSSPRVGRALSSQRNGMDYRKRTPVAPSQDIQSDLDRFIRETSSRDT